jgi:hypothetical protein
MKEKLATILLTAIYTGENPRIYKEDHIDGLARDIRENGLIDRITVWDHPSEDDKSLRYQALKGHCRLKAINRIKAADPTRFEELFPGGKVDVHVYDSSTTEDEALKVKLDHGQQAELSNWYELYLSAFMLFLSGLKEKEVVIRLSHLMDRVAQLKGKAKEKIDALRAAVTEARDAGDYREVVRREDKLEDELFTTRRGMVQNLNRVRKSPKLIEASMYYLYVGTVPDGYEAEQLIKSLTNRDIRKLAEEHVKDIDIKVEGNLDESGVPKYSRDIPGPNFWKLWNEIKAAKAGESTGEPRPKAMSANAMSEEIKDGKYRSAIAILVTRRHAGEQDIDTTEADSRAYYADMVAKHAPDVWSDVEKRAKDIIADVQAASEQAAKEAAKKKEDSK